MNAPELATAKDHTVHLIACPAVNGRPGCTCPVPGAEPYTAETIVGALFHHDRQPHGSLYVRITEARQWTQADVDTIEAEYKAKGWWHPGCCTREKYLADEGFFMLRGVVESGRTVNRLFQHTTTRDEAGTAWNLDNVRPCELAAAHKISVAM